jgi:hypothetical protein
MRLFNWTLLVVLCFSLCSCRQASPPLKDDAKSPKDPASVKKEKQAAHERRLQAIQASWDKRLEFLLPAEQVELYSLEPRDGQDEKRKGSLYGWTVLGKTDVNDMDARKKLLDVAKGMSFTSASGSMCAFEPRHAVRVRYADTTFELLICFQCSQVRTYLNGKEDTDPPFDGKGKQPALDEILNRAMVPLAIPPRKIEE